MKNEWRTVIVVVAGLTFLEVLALIAGKLALDASLVTSLALAGAGMVGSQAWKSKGEHAARAGVEAARAGVDKIAADVSRTLAERLPRKATPHQPHASIDEDPPTGPR